MHTHTHTCTYIYIHIYIYLFTCTHIYVGVHMCTYSLLHISRGSRWDHLLVNLELWKRSGLGECRLIAFDSSESSRPEISIWPMMYSFSYLSCRGVTIIWNNIVIGWNLMICISGFKFLKNYSFIFIFFFQSTPLLFWLSDVKLKPIWCLSSYCFISQPLWL